MQYLVTLDVDQEQSEDPANLSSVIASKLTECAEGVDGVLEAHVVALA